MHKESGRALLGSFSATFFETYKMFTLLDRYELKLPAIVATFALMKLELILI